MQKPAVKPKNPYFSSGPCAKRPNWSPEALAGAVLGQSHRGKAGKAKLAEVIQLTKEILPIPEDYHSTDQGNFTDSRRLPRGHRPGL